MTIHHYSTFSQLCPKSPLLMHCTDKIYLQSLWHTIYKYIIYYVHFNIAQLQLVIEHWLVWKLHIVYWLSSQLTILFYNHWIWSAESSYKKPLKDQTSQKNFRAKSRSVSESDSKSLHDLTKSPKSDSGARKADRRARYWKFLFDNLQRAVDAIYDTCETDESVVECKVKVRWFLAHLAVSGIRRDLAQFSLKQWK